MASASVAARRVKVTVSLSVPTDRPLWRSYRPPRSRRSRSSITWRSACTAWSTCPGAWPRWQLSATRALYRGPEGSGADLFGCSGTVGTARQLAWHTGERTEPAGEPILPSCRLTRLPRVAPTASAQRHVETSTSRYGEHAPSLPCDVADPQSRASVPYMVLTRLRPSRHRPQSPLRPGCRGSGVLNEIIPLGPEIV